MGFGLAGSTEPPLTCPPVGIPLCPLNRFFAVFTTKLLSPRRSGRSLLLLLLLPPRRCTVLAKSCAAASQPARQSAAGSSLLVANPQILTLRGSRLRQTDHYVHRFWSFFILFHPFSDSVIYVKCVLAYAAVW